MAGIFGQSSCIKESIYGLWGAYMHFFFSGGDTHLPQKVWGQEKVESKGRKKWAKMSIIDSLQIS